MDHGDELMKERTPLEQAVNAALRECGRTRNHLALEVDISCVLRHIRPVIENLSWADFSRPTSEMVIQMGPQAIRVIADLRQHRFPNDHSLVADLSKVEVAEAYTLYIAEVLECYTCPEK